MIHPPGRLISYPRYILDEKGNRKKGRQTYRKISVLKEKNELLKKKYSYLLVNDNVLKFEAPEIAQKEVIMHYKPEQALKALKERSLDNLEQIAVDFSELLENHSGIPSSFIGISGSIMVGLHIASSDIDLIIYGKNQSRKVRNLLTLLLKEEDQVKPLTVNEMVKLYEARGANTLMPFEIFFKHEKRKTFQGVFREKEFFIRYLPNWLEVNERYGDRRFIPEGYVKVKAYVKDASEGFYSPCKYLLEQVEVLEGVKVQNILEAVSFRGRFCEQAKTGESVLIQGKLEKVLTSDGEYYRVLLGGNPSDFMISLSL